MKVEIIVFPGFDELDAFGPLEVLRNAAAVRSELEVRLVSASGGKASTTGWARNTAIRCGKET